MPRPRKTPVVNNGPVDVPNPPTQAANAANFPEAYDEKKVTRSKGVPIEQVALSRPFGPGADYASNVTKVRYHDPETGRTLETYIADGTIQAIETWCEMMEERGYIPCVAIDAPKPAKAARQSDPLDEDKDIGRRARTARQSRFDDDETEDSPVVNFGKYNGQTVAEIYASGKRGQQYVEWLADNARQRDIRKAAQSMID